jgi:muconolactone D-isomerase
VDFLVRIEIDLPAELSAERREAVIAAEEVRGRELLAAGTIREIWRIPGRRSNVAVWQAADATELHALLSSLPLFPWMDAEVTPLARHPLTMEPSRWPTS